MCICKYFYKYYICIYIHIHLRYVKTAEGAKKIAGIKLVAPFGQLTSCMALKARTVRVFLAIPSLDISRVHKGKWLKPPKP